MNNDLISREALKKAIQNREECKECTDIDCIHCFYDMLDNAETVEPEVYMTGKDYNLYLEGYKQGKKDFSRPQGEWVDTNSGYKCSVCGASNDYAYDEYKHKFTDYFCPNCGAKMKQG